MTNSINTQNTKYQAPYPANYSGVTINVTNPSLSSVPQITAYPNYVQNQVQPCQICPQQSFAPQPTQIPQQNFSQQINYPSDYYMNNYNTPTQTPPINQNYQPDMNPYNQQYYNKMQQDNLEASKEIIKKLDAIYSDEKKQEKNTIKKEVTILTNEYIMSIENFLNNPNKDVRRKGAKQVINRLGEDRSRKNDAALNALLNKMLQDPDKGVRTLALSAFASGLATGNEYSVQLLKRMEANPQLYPEDMDLVMDSLLMMSAGTKTIYVDAPAKK